MTVFRRERAEPYRAHKSERENSPLDGEEDVPLGEKSNGFDG